MWKTELISKECGYLAEIFEVAGFYIFWFLFAADSKIQEERNKLREELLKGTGT